MEMKRKVWRGLIVVLLIIALPTFVNDQSNKVIKDNHINPEQVVKSKVSRIQDLPITITDNSGFTTAGFSGSGSATTPYLLKDITIAAGGVSGINISDTTAYFRIENVTINGSTDINARGIILTNVIHGTIDNNTIYNCDGGIALGSSENNVVVNNTIYNITKVGINIYAGASKDNIVSGNIIYNLTGPNSKGIDISYSAKNNTISGNEIFNCAYYAIVMGTQAYNNTISDNNIFNCTYNALYIVTNTHHNLFTNNKIHDCISHAIFSFLNANNNTYANNSFYNLQNGIVMDNSSDNILRGNTFHNITNIGIWLYSTSQNNTLASNRITDCNTGIHISTSNSSNVLDNTISNCATNGIYLSSASNDSIVKRNVLFNNSQYGIYIDTTSENNKVEWNSFLHNNGSGIQAYDNGTNNIFDYNHWNDRIEPDMDADGFIDSVYPLDGTPGVSNGGLSLNGTINSYVITNPVSMFPTDALTVELWLKSRDNSKYLCLVSYAILGSTYNDFLLTYDYTTDQIQIYRNTSLDNTGCPLSEHVWTHLVVTWRSSDGEITLWKDGVLRYTGNASMGENMVTGGSFVLGQDQDTVGGGFQPNQAFNGTLDEVRVLTSVLNQSEIQADYNARGPYPARTGTIAWYHLDDTGTTATDSAGGVGHGTVVGGEWVDGVRFNFDPHPRVAPIWINENSDFADLARSGDGTLNDPYLIEGYQFTSNQSVLISITNTTAHFRIEDVLINGLTNTGVAGISLKNVTNGQIKRTTVTNCYRGLVLEIANITIQDNSFSNIANTGIYVISRMFNSVIAGNGFNSSGTAIALVSSEYNIITNNSITNILNAGLSFGTGCGIYVPYSAYNKVVNNTIRDVNTHGILIGEISHGNDVINNAISNAGVHGVVVFHYTGATTITENNITDVGGRGISIESVCNDAIITNNTITNASQQGIFLWNGDRATVSRNIVYNSTGYGIELHTESNDNEVTWNSFIQNNQSGSQAYDNGSANLLSYNYWDDLTPTDIDNDGFVDNSYVITGPVNNADPLPRAELIPRPQSIVINGPNNFAMFYGETGYSLTWTVTVTYHDSYTVYRNGTVIAIGSRGLGNWTDTILISLDGTNTGLNNFTLNILDSYDITGSHTVWVTVKEPDVTPPTINSPSDLSFEEGSIGYSITWTGDDEHPWRAIILLNSTPVYNESWTGENITARLDPIDRYPQTLTTGVHNFTCVLYDWEGRWTGNSVLVTITPLVPDVIPPIITAPAPLEYVEGTTGNYLTWNASDDHPKAYQWFANETKQGYYPWHGGAFNISVDRFQVGIWNITVNVFDLSGNNVTASTVVTVLPIPPDVTPPSVSSPADLEIYENSSKSIVWEVSDDYPDKYVIYKNSSTVVKQGYWSTGIIQYLLTNLTVNTWELNLTVWDESDNWNSSVVIVTVLPGRESESTAPVIALMSDLTIEFGSTGNIATFRVFDEHPGSIEVLLDGTRISQLPWFDANQKVVVSLDGLAIGTYNFTLVAWDIFGNSASRSITVQVTGDSNPPVLSSPDSISVSSPENATITWTTSDENLAYYEIFLVHANGTVKQLQTESLTGMTSETIQFTISGFQEGEYTIRLIVYDTAGHRTVDEVFVIVGPSVVQRSPGFEFVPLLAILLLYAISRRAGRKRKQDQLRRINL